MRMKKQQFVVFGLGRFGSSVAKNLCAMGHEVLAVDHDQEAVDAIAPYVTQSVQADVTDEEVLTSLGLGNFDAAVVGIGSDVRDSVLVSLLCKEAGIPLVIAKAMDDLHGKVLSKIGVDRVIFPERDSGARLARALASPGVVDLMELEDGYQVAEVVAPEAWAGKTLMGLNVRRNFGVSVIAVRRGEKFMASPEAEFILRSGDTMVLLGKDEDIERIEQK